MSDETDSTQASPEGASVRELRGIDGGTAKLDPDLRHLIDQIKGLAGALPGLGALLDPAAVRAREDWLVWASFANSPAAAKVLEMTFKPDGGEGEPSAVDIVVEFADAMLDAWATGRNGATATQSPAAPDSTDLDDPSGT